MTATRETLTDEEAALCDIDRFDLWYDVLALRRLGFDVTYNPNGQRAEMSPHSRDRADRRLRDLAACLELEAVSALVAA